MHLFQKTLPKDTENKELLEEIERVKMQMENAHYNFQNAMDPDLIDCYIYEVNAVMKRYRYLLNQAAALSPLPEEESVNLNAEPPIGALVG